MITAQEIYERVKKRQPFVPVQVVTHNGDRFDIRRPDLVLIGVQDMYIGLTTPRNREYYDRLVRVLFSDIRDLVDVTPPRKKTKRRS